MWCSAKVSSHQQEAWGGRVGWKVQTACAHAHVPRTSTHGWRLGSNGLRSDSGMPRVTASGCRRSHFLWVIVLIRHLSTNNRREFHQKSNATLQSPAVPTRDMHKWNGFKILKWLRLLFYQAESKLTPSPAPETRTRLGAHIPTDERESVGLTGSVPNFPQPPGSNQII